MKETEPMVKDVKRILNNLNHEQTYRPFYNDKRENGRRIKMPFRLNEDTSMILQRELNEQFPECSIVVKDHYWANHWWVEPHLVTTVHVKRKY